MYICIYWSIWDVYIYIYIFFPFDLNCVIDYWIVPEIGWFNFYRDVFFFCFFLCARSALVCSNCFPTSTRAWQEALRHWLCYNPDGLTQLLTCFHKPFPPASLIVTAPTPTPLSTKSTMLLLRKDIPYNHEPSRCRLHFSFRERVLLCARFGLCIWECWTFYFGN